MFVLLLLLSAIIIIMIVIVLPDGEMLRQSAVEVGQPHDRGGRGAGAHAHIVRLVRCGTCQGEGTGKGGGREKQTRIYN